MEAAGILAEHVVHLVWSEMTVCAARRRLCSDSGRIGSIRGVSVLDLLTNVYRLLPIQSGMAFSIPPLNSIVQGSIRDKKAGRRPPFFIGPNI